MSRTLKLSEPTDRVLSPGDRSIADAMQAWAADMRRRMCAEKSVERMTDHTRRCVNYHGWAGLRDMTRDGLTAWLDYGRVEKGWKPATINSSLTSLRAFGRFCVEAGWLPSNPFTGVNNAKNTSRGAYGCFTVEQARAMIRAAMRATSDGRARGNRALFYGVLFLTGLRVEEATQLRWRDLDLTRGVLTTDPAWAKNGLELAIPIAPQLASRLAAWRLETGGTPDDRVFPVAPNRETWRADRESAGVPETTEQGRKLSRHACRATLASWLYGLVLPDGSRVSEAVVKSILRHDQTSTHARYLNLSNEERLAVAALANIFPDSDPKDVDRGPEISDTLSAKTSSSTVPKPAAHTEGCLGRPPSGLSAGLDAVIPAKGPGDGSTQQRREEEAGTRHSHPAVDDDLIEVLRNSANLMLSVARALAKRGV